MLFAVVLALTACTDETQPPADNRGAKAIAAEQRQEIKYKPYSVVCDHNGHFAITTKEGELNEYSDYTSYEDAKLQADYLLQKWEMSKTKKALSVLDELEKHARENKARDWHQCEMGEAK